MNRLPETTVARGVMISSWPVRVNVAVAPATLTRVTARRRRSRSNTASRLVAVAVIVAFPASSRVSGSYRRCRS